MMLPAAIHAVVRVEEKDAPTVVILLWIAVVGGGILGLVLTSVANSSYNVTAAKAARYSFMVAAFAVIPALSLSCSMAAS
jgi:hypothetical protein